MIKQLFTGTLDTANFERKIYIQPCDHDIIVKRAYKSRLYNEIAMEQNHQELQIMDFHNEKLVRNPLVSSLNKTIDIEPLSNQSEDDEEKWIDSEVMKVVERVLE